MQQFSCETLADLAVPGPATGRLAVLALYGTTDAATGPVLAAAFAAHGSAQLVVDLSGLHRLDAACAEVLHRCAETAAAHGRPLRLVGCAPEAAALLARTRAGRTGPELYRSVADALAAALTVAAALPGPAAAAPYLRTDAVELRHAVRAQALIGRAQGMLMERYGLRDADTAEALLEAVARRHGVRTVHLASAFVRQAPPRTGHVWFPGHPRPVEPAVGFAGPPGHRPPSLSAFLDALRDAVCAITHADMADVQLIDAGDHTLRLESHRGLPADFVRFFAVVDEVSTACGQAARKGRRVVVDDVATAPEYDEPSRAAMLAAHSRSLQCTPIPGPGDRPQGMFSTHHDRPGHAYTEAEFGALDTAAREAGAWLDWYRATTVTDALEDLHRTAQLR
ncbi:STAS domain-containing protein [Streptomyces collinus]|uniref:STAS domain-containing protein n=2 Tax=Streptomyces collinus TaxID=42684 RepID=UPI0033B3F51B